MVPVATSEPARGILVLEEAGLLGAAAGRVREGADGRGLCAPGDGPHLAAMTVIVLCAYLFSAL